MIKVRTNGSMQSIVVEAVGKLPDTAAGDPLGLKTPIKHYSLFADEAFGDALTKNCREFIRQQTELCTLA
jgi:hypothetical protein